MKIKIGINGMGRIGRMIIRSIIESNNKNIEINHINIELILKLAQLFYNVTQFMKFETDISFDDNHLIINKKKKFSPGNKLKRN